MDFEHDREANLNPPSAWFVLCQMLAVYATLFLALIGIAAIVDQIMPGRTVRADLLVGGFAFIWVFLMRRLGVISKPRRPKDGARAVLFAVYFVCFASISPLVDWWARAPNEHQANRIMGSVLTALLVAGFMSLSEKGAWRDESAGEPPAHQTPQRTV